MRYLKTLFLFIGTILVYTALSSFYSFSRSKSEKDISYNIINNDSITDIYIIEGELPMPLLPEGFSRGVTKSSNKNQLLEWFGLFKNRAKYYLKKTKLNIELTYDGLEGDIQEDPSTWSALDIITDNKDTAIILIGDPNKTFKNLEIKEPIIANKIINLEDTIYIEMNAITYKLFIIAERNISEDNESYSDLENFELFLQAEKNGTTINQLLASVPYFNERFFSLMFAGDIDNDGIPDFLINTAYDYVSFTPTLFLSSYARDNELVKIVGQYDSYAC